MTQSQSVFLFLINLNLEKEHSSSTKNAKESKEELYNVRITYIDDYLFYYFMFHVLIFHNNNLCGKLFVKINKKNYCLKVDKII